MRVVLNKKEKEKEKRKLEKMRAARTALKGVKNAYDLSQLIPRDVMKKIHPPCQDFIMGGCGNCPSYCHQ